ncbi:ATP-binding protein [Caenimonas aquaedulcis]|uniref:histidine kinase n=1 Tax=Caenimonas aquaedulcis TaxID=2793270 RepID=A0A931H448_9BURK|nr:ATP-binding protein [Caenimonas aquaedulcis]MBG9388266.1 histidine kinase [Caenimonas aquaedulcis]
MKVQDSIRARLILGAAVVLVTFVAGAGWAVQRAHQDSVLTQRFAQLQSTVYLLLAGAEIDDAGALVMPPSFPEPRLSLPASGLYANVVNVAKREEWQSPSTVGAEPPFQRDVPVGQWRYDTRTTQGRTYLAASYGVSWAGKTQPVPLVLSVLEDKSEFNREIAVFERTMWTWLAGASLLLLLSQTLLLEWGLSPLRRVAREVRRIEQGEQSEVEGRYPAEIAALTGNLNTLIKQERVRQTRYKEALSFLAHSLKTPLAVLRGALHEPAELPAAVTQQVARMDDIVQHQLGRAAASGLARFAPHLAIAPVLHRIRDSLQKVYADKSLDFAIDCPAGLSWRIDEGDAFEMLGNVMDNAAKWAVHRVRVKAWTERRRLVLEIDDDGKGFGDTQAILQLHVRADEQVPGHGVGLAVVNDLVASHEGELKLERSEWGGGRVRIALPAA